MTETPDELQAWLREQLDDAVVGLININVFEDALIEIKPAWVLPMRLLVGKAREQNNPTNFRWFICGEVPLDHIGADSATTPREVIRHFALKWQIDASKLDGEAAKTMIDDAESLYALADDERFWS
jgi:hypothetical protein